MLTLACSPAACPGSTREQSQGVTMPHLDHVLIRDCAGLKQRCGIPRLVVARALPRRRDARCSDAAERLLPSRTCWRTAQQLPSARNHPSAETHHAQSQRAAHWRAPAGHPRSSPRRTRRLRRSTPPCARAPPRRAGSARRPARTRAPARAPPLRPRRRRLGLSAKKSGCRGCLSVPSSTYGCGVACSRCATTHVTKHKGAPRHPPGSFT